MAETLKVVFQADDSELQSALSRSTRRIDDFDKRFSKRRDALPVPTSSFNAWETSASRAAKATKQLEMAGYRAGKGGMAGSFGFLAFSQAVEDAQYGVRGILNNIPQMVIGFGGSMGMAGAISLAAVAASQAAFAFQKLSGIDEMEAWAKATTAASDAITKSLREQRAEAEALAAAREGEFRRSQISDRAAGDRESLKSDAVAMKEIERAAAAVERVLDARQSLGSVLTSSVAEPADGRQLGQQLTDKARLDFFQRQQRLTAELTESQSALNLVSEEYQRIWKEIGDQTGSLRFAQMEADRGVETAREAVNALKTEIAGLVPFTGDDVPESSQKSSATLKLADAKEKLAIEQAYLKEREKESALYEQLIEQARSEGRASIQELSGKREALRDNIAAIRDTIKAQDELAAATKDSIALQALRKQEEVITTARDEADARVESLRTLEDELAVLQARAKYGNDYADTLQREIDLRNEANKLAADTGIDPAQAKKFLRDKLDLQQQIDARNKEAQGTIRERRQARSDERAAERQQARNERVAEARRKREEKNKRDNDSKLDPEEEKDLQRQKEIEQARQKAIDDRNKANEKLGENVAEQLDIQKNIKTAIDKISAA